MAIAWNAVGTAVAGSGVNPVLTPVGPSSGNNTRNYLAITWKDHNITPPGVTSGTGTWTLLAREQQSGVTTGVDVGSINIDIYYADGTCPTSNSITFSGTVGAAQAVIFNLSKSASEYFQHQHGQGQDSTNGANISVTTSPVVTTTAVSDVVIAVSGANSDGGTPSAVAITNTSTVTNRLDSASITGDDSRLSIWTAVPTTTETAARTFSYTNASASSASVVLISLRVNDITFGSAGTESTGSGTNPVLSPGAASPSGSTYRNFLYVIWKASDKPEPVIASSTGTWIRVTGMVNTTFTATGVDVGSMRSVLYYANGTCPTGTTVTFTGSIGSAQAVVVNWNNSHSTRSMSHTVTTGQDNTHGANYTATATGNFNATADTAVAMFHGFNTDGGTISAESATAPGLVMGAIDGFHHSINSPTGDDNRLRINSTGVTSGTQTGGVTYTHTNATSAKGVSIFLQLFLIGNPTMNVVPGVNFYANPGYQITLNDIEGFDKFEILRTDETGLPEAEVRGAQQQLITGNTFGTEDYEFRFGAAGWQRASNTLTYTANFYEGGQIVFTLTDSSQSGLNDLAAAITALGSGLPDEAFPKTFLSIPEIPSLNIPVAIEDFKTWSFQGRILSESHVLGRMNPVVSTDVTGNIKGDFKLLVAPGVQNSYFSVPSNVTEYIDLLKSGNTFLMRNIAPVLVGFDDFYFIINSATPTRLNRVPDQVAMLKQTRANPAIDVDDSYLPVMSIDITFTQVDAPPNGAAVSQYTWQTLLDNFSSWQDILDLFPTWLQVLQTTDGNF